VTRVTETVIEFENPSGHTLRGILHMPGDDLAARAPLLLWLSAGQKVRQGSWRMNVAIARRAAAAGAAVLRFDYQGFGDSDGPRRHGEAVMDLYGTVQTGGMRDDVVAAVDHGLRMVGARPVVLGGLCGGAVSALFAASALKRRIWGHLLVDLPVTISSSARQQFLEAHPEALVRARPEVADTVLTLYARKLFDVASWQRFLRGESNPRLFAEAMRVKARAAIAPIVGRLPAVERVMDRTLGPLVDAAVETDADTVLDPAAAAREAARGEVRNELLAPTFRAALAASQRVRFVNSSAYHPTFMTHFGDAELPRAQGVTLTVVPDTNHIFSFEHSQRALFEAVDATLREAAGAV
jgi:pimeloyl-ACP methyl ester carboxylesterase